MRIVDVVRTAARLVAIGGLVAAAGGPVLVAVARIEPGQWQLRDTGSAAPPRAVCIGDAAALIQYGHGGGAACRRLVITDEADIATVHYTCPGVGHGRTTFKVATPRAFNLETQGIVNGAPFDERFEARRVGACPPGAQAAR